ncbi:MAG: YhdH/YhfP family quinone oxidoreductase [Sinobacterium sp.]|nr:YhdH/YhfP family quinone oxidoreductase [Sinobacterium sp.]
MSDNYKSFWVEAKEDTFVQSIATRNISQLPQHGLLIEVHYSSLNFKDALSASGNKGVTREFPHQPGIDAAGIVIKSDDNNFAEGDEVIVTGYDLGMNTAGGLGEYIRVPANWAIKKPNGISLRQSMLFGTAGLTAQLCIQKLLRMGLTPGQGDVLVTGATGGVGSIATALLSQQGFSVTASSGKSDQHSYLTAIGAATIIDRITPSDADKKPMLKELYAGAIDVAGGNTLSHILKQIKSGGSVAICGLVESHKFDSTVLPFILRGINLLGVDSVDIPLSQKQQVWNELSALDSYDALELINEEIDLNHVPEKLSDILHGKGSRHCLVKVK